MSGKQKLILFVGLSIIYFLAVFSLTVLEKRLEEGVKFDFSKQNVVCDLVYGVQYFEHNGILTVRLNHEGTPVRCFEEETK